MSLMQSTTLNKLKANLITELPFFPNNKETLQELEGRFTPGMVFFLAGADPHEGDRLGRLKLTADGLEARDRRVLDWCWQRRMPAVITMGGGYGVNLKDTVGVQLTTYRVAASYRSRWAGLLEAA